MKNLSLIYKSIKEFLRSGNYWKIIGIGAIVSFVGLLFGLAFWLIFEGVFSLLHRWTPYWRPAHKLFGKLSLAASDSLEPLSGWKWAQFILITIPPSLLILGGLYILGRTGFENQNLFYMLMKK
jgi:hypothetical protein